MKNIKAGDNVYVLERNEYSGEIVDYTSYMYLAIAAHGVIVSSFINETEDISEIIDYHIRETRENEDTELAVFPTEDCFTSAEEAREYIKKAVA